MSNGRILIIDDAPDVHQTAGMALELGGFEVAHASDGKSGLHTLISQEPFDLILLDIQMPVMDGFAVLDAINADPALREIPVLVLSSLDRANLKVRAFQAGADDYILKPFHPAELVARVTRAIERKRRVGQETAEGLRGAFDHIPFEDLLQIIETGGKNASVRLPDLSASLSIRNGALAGAQWKSFQGEEAFARILLLSHGGFIVEPETVSSAPEPAPEPGRLRDLLFDWTVRFDELARLLPELRDRAAEFRAASPQRPGTLPESVWNRLPLPVPVLVAELPGTLEENVQLVVQELQAGTLAIHVHDEE